jgi:hypothetical protein
MIDKKYKLGICYKYNNKLCNSIEEEHDIKKEEYSLVHCNISLNEFYNGKYNTYLNYINKNLIAFYNKQDENNKIDKSKLAQLVIYKKRLLETGELMALNNNFWLNVFIRKVKKYYKHKLNNSNFIVYRNRIKYGHYNEIVKQTMCVEKVILNTTFENVKIYVLELNKYYRELREKSEKLNIKNETSGYEMTFTIENCNKKMLFFNNYTK